MERIPTCFRTFLGPILRLKAYFVFWTAVNMKKNLCFAEGTGILFRFEDRSLIWRKRITARRVSSSPLSFLVPYCGWPRLTTYFTFKMTATKETRACRRDLFFNIVGLQSDLDAVISFIYQEHKIIARRQFLAYAT